MGGLNTTGTPNVDDYSLGRGKVYLATLGTDDAPGAYIDLGNAPKFTCKIATEELKHMSSRSGVKTVDKTVVTSQETSGSFTLDEVNFGNLALFLGGAASAGNTNAAVAGFAEYKMIDGVVLGRWYEIRNSSGVRAYDLTAGDVTVEVSGAPDVALVLNTDYSLDLDMGLIFFPSTGGTAVANDDIDVTLAAKAGAKTLSKVIAAQGTNTYYALKFLSNNPVDDNAEQEWQFHKVTLRGNGDIGLIDDKFVEIGFEFTATRSNWTAVSASPTLTVTTHDLANNNL